MEKEEREAQSAKLQELIRRGTPEDLQEANRLMKVMTGYDTRSKTDYRAKAAEEVAKIQAKARILEERLEAFQPGDSMKDGDVFEELAAALSSAQPKIQKMCEEESDDHEAVAKLFEINDSIHRTVERWKLLKKGDVEGAQKLAQGAPLPSLPSSVSKSSGKATSSANELSLIDFDADAADAAGAGSNGTSAEAAGSSSQAGGVENDLLGLSLGDNSSSFGQGGGISLGFGANQSMLPPLPLPLTPYPSCVLAHSGTDQLSDIPGPALLSSVTQNSTAGGAPVSSPTPPPFSPFSGFVSQPSGSQSATPQPSLLQQSTFSQPPPPQKPTSDPFAALASSQLSSKSSTPKLTTPAAPPPPAATNNDDDEWAFSSALPPEAPSLPVEHKVNVKDNPLQIDMHAKRNPQSPNALALQFAFSNNTPMPLSDLHFQLAVTKVSCCLGVSRNHTFYPLVTPAPRKKPAIH